jgi:MinD-like ATPase involved in chromosome partitioning or flagellar assembly
MSQTITLHSFHRGVGKTFAAVNLTVALALKGWRVAIVDTSLQSPGVHYPFGIREDTIEYSLNDFLHGRCDIQQATYNITPQIHAEMKGEIFLTPASIDAEDILQIVRTGCNLDVFHKGLDDLIDKLNLDAIVIDTHAGLDEQTLKIIALSNTLIILMRLEQQEYQGTGVTVDVARKLDVSDVQIAASQTPPVYTVPQIEQQVRNAYHCPLLMSLPHSNDVIELGGAELFLLRYPHHSITTQINQAAAQFTMD